MKHLGLFENFKKYFPIQIPPGKEESIELIMKYGDKTWWIGDFETSDPEVIREMFSKDCELNVRHEALHILQKLNIPEIFVGYGDITIKGEWFSQISENNFSISGIEHQENFRDYFTREYEIMAYAFSYILIKKSPGAKIKQDGTLCDSEFEENADKIYKSIDRGYYDRFLYYCDEYLKVKNI